MEDIETTFYKTKCVPEKIYLNELLFAKKNSARIMAERIEFLQSFSTNHLMYFTLELHSPNGNSCLSCLA